MNKRTPGPWKWEPSDPTIEGPNGGAVCHVAQHANVRTGLATGEYFNSADARLIVAAPTMLSMLKDSCGCDVCAPCARRLALIRSIEGGS